MAAAHRYASSSDCSEASSAGGGLDDSSNASAGASAAMDATKPASRSLPDVLSRVAEEGDLDQKRPAVARSLPDVLSREDVQESADLSGLLTSPLIDCHIEKKDSKEDEEHQKQQGKDKA